MDDRFPKEFILGLAGRIEAELMALQSYNTELASNYNGNIVMTPHRLLEIRYQIRLCDFFAYTNNHKMILFHTYLNWRKCVAYCVQNRPNVDGVHIMDLQLRTKRSPEPKVTIIESTSLVKREEPTRPQKSWEEMINENDAKFLKGIRVDHEIEKYKDIK